MESLLQQLRIDYRIRAGYGVAFILLFFSYLLTWYTNRQSIAQTQWVVKTYAAINHLDNLSSYMKDAETGVRGYLITKDHRFLDPYYNSIGEAGGIYNMLAAEEKDNAIQFTRLAIVKHLIDEKYKILGKLISYDPADSSLTKDAALKLLYTGKDIMDSIRSKIGLMQITEEKVLDERNEELRSRYAAMNIIIAISLSLAFLSMIYGFITYLRENVAHKKAEKKVKEYQDQLHKQIQELDIANKELIEMRRTEQFAATGRIARTIAHEVRNPLTNIDLAAGQIKTELPTTDENVNMLFDMISRNSKRINQLITELLNATRFADLRFENVSVNALLEETLELAQDRINLYRIIVEKNFTKDICPISVDPAKIKIAFLNIILNAIEAMEVKNQRILKISTTEKDKKCVVEISDNGKGIDAMALGKLFEPYFTTKPKGNGLGLTNTQNIILNHGGTINVDSTPGYGTTFIIKFNFAPQ